MILNALIVAAGTTVAIAVALLGDSWRKNRQERASTSCDLHRDNVRRALDSSHRFNGRAWLPSEGVGRVGGNAKGERSPVVASGHGSPDGAHITRHAPSGTFSTPAVSAVQPERTPSASSEAASRGVGFLPGLADTAGLFSEPVRRRAKESPASVHAARPCELNQVRKFDTASTSSGRRGI